MDIQAVRQAATVSRQEDGQAGRKQVDRKMVRKAGRQAVLQ
jgi:hypothetical protein